MSAAQPMQALPEEAVATYGCTAGIGAGLISGIAIATIAQEWSPPARYAALFLGCASACAATNLIVSAACAELTPYGRLSRAHRAIHQLEHDTIVKDLCKDHVHIVLTKNLSLRLAKLQTLALETQKNLQCALEEATNNKYPQGIAQHCKELLEHLHVILEKISRVKGRIKPLT